MIVSRFKSQQDLVAFGQEIAELFDLSPLEDGRYHTAWGTKTAEGLARSVERLYRERVYGLEEQISEDDHYSALTT